MTLSRKIVDAVDSLPSGSLLPGLVEAEAGASRLALNLTAQGPVGRITYLMEPLVVLEVDARAGEAELRSQVPTPRGGRRCFYEVRLRREGSLHLRRVAFDEQARTRQAVPCQLTTYVLERLAADPVASLP